jgi:hypothetical protein
MENSGTIRMTSVAAQSSITQYGIRVTSNADGSVINSGTIVMDAISGTDATQYGIYVGNSSGGTIANTGSIVMTARAGTEGLAYGIRASTLSNSATVSNSGLIDIKMSSYSENTVYGIRTNDVLSGSSVSNTGTIRIRAEDQVSYNTAYGIRTNSVNAGTVSNSGVIDIQGTPRGQFGEVGNYLYGMLYQYTDGCHRGEHRHHSPFRPVARRKQCHRLRHLDLAP